MFSTPNSGIDWPATPSWPISPTAPSPPDDKSNTIPIVVDQSMARVNQPAVTITLCPPSADNTSQCVTVKNMLVDTGSVGVRVTSSALTDALKSQLLTQVGATDDKIGNAPIVQCSMFACGFTWGPIKRADVMIGGKKASNLPIQVIGDGGYARAERLHFAWRPEPPLLARLTRQHHIQRYRRHRPFRARHRDCGTNADTGDVLLLLVHKRMFQHTRAASEAGHESGRSLLNP
jgi:hypothetical protein